MGISSAVEEVLGGRDAGQFAELTIEVGLIGIASFECNIDPAASCFIEAIFQNVLESEQARIDAGSESHALAEKLYKMPVTVACLFDNFANFSGRRKTAQCMRSCGMYS